MAQVPEMEIKLTVVGPTIFIVEHGWDHEGSNVIRVFATIEEAIAFVEKEIADPESWTFAGDYIHIDEYRIGDHGPHGWMQTIKRWQSEYATNEKGGVTGKLWSVEPIEETDV